MPWTEAHGGMTPEHRTLTRPTPDHGSTRGQFPKGPHRSPLRTDSACQNTTAPENPSPHPHPSPYPHPMQRAQAIPSITTTPEQVPAR